MACGFLYLVHFLLLGLGAYLWQSNKSAENTRTNFYASAFCGMALMLCGYFSGSSINPMLLAAFAWTPLVLLAIDRIIAGGGLRWIAALALLLGMQVSAGRPEIIASAMLLYLAYSLYELWHLRRQKGVNESTVLRLFGGAVLGIAFGAADYLPLVQMTRANPPVGGFDKLGAGFWSTGPYEFLTMLVSQPLGDLSMDRYGIYPTYPGVMPYVTSLFLGAPVLTLALIGFAHKEWRCRWFWLTVAVIAVIVSCGDFAPLFPLCAKLLHNRVVFRYPVKFGIFICLAIIVAAAEGWRCCFAGAENKSRRILLVPGAIWCTLLAYAGVLLVSPTAAMETITHLSGAWQISADALTRNLLEQMSTKFALQVFYAAMSGVGCLVLISMATRTTAKAADAPQDSGQSADAIPSKVNRTAQGAPPYIQPALLLLIALLLLKDDVANLWHTVGSEFFYKKSDVAERLIAEAQPSMPDFRVLSLLDDPLPVPASLTPEQGQDKEQAFMQYARRVLRSNTNIDQQIRLINGMPIIPTWRSFFLATGLLPRSSQQPDVKHPAGKSDLPLFRWCQATTTTFVLTSSRDFTEDGRSTPVPLLDRQLFQLELDDPKSNLRIYRVPTVRPRVSLVFKAVEIPDREKAMMIINRCDVTGWDPLRTVLITFSEREDATLSKPLTQQQLEYIQDQIATAPSAIASEGSVKIMSEQNDCLTLDVNTSMSATVIVTDSYCPGWEATDNGKPTDILIADGLERAIRLAPGRHTIVFTYKPQSYLLGLEINHGVAVVILLLFLFDFRRAKRTGDRTAAS